MNTVIFQTENAVFTFNKKEMRDHLIGKKTEYVPNENAQLLELISTGSDETIFNSGDDHYFGYVVLDIISEGIGTVTCKICDKTYDAGQLKEFAIGYGKSPFDTNQEQKGEFSLFEKKKMPSMFGGKGYECPEGHKLISIETWKT